MKKNILYLLLFFLVFIYGCGENMYADVDNNYSLAAKQDQLDFEFIGNNCAPVMNYYNSVDSTGAALSRDDTFKFLSAILHCGGFNVIVGIDMVSKTGTSDVYGVVAGMLGISEVTFENLNAISPYYKKTVDICYIRHALAKDNNTTLDKSTASLCGFAGMISTALNVSSLIISIAGEDIPVKFSKIGFQQALKQIDINMAVDNFFANAENDTYLEELTLTLNTAFNGLSSMESFLGGSTDMVNEMKSSLFDEVLNQVSEDKLKSYITSIQEGQNISSNGANDRSQGNG